MKMCCFIGHRFVTYTEDLHNKIKSVIKSLLENGVHRFLFGSKSEFTDICVEIVSELKKEYPFLIRVYVRAEYEYIDKDYEDFLLNRFDKTYFANKAHNAGRLVYVMRNQEMIDLSDVCVFYYCINNYDGSKSSGTEIAYNYAVKKHKDIINVFDC